MRALTNNPVADPALVLYQRCTINLDDGEINMEEIPCHNLEDVLGGFGRSFQMLAEREITDAYSEKNPLIMNTGLLTGSNLMTGMRTYFSAYSPLKKSKRGLPAAMWSTGSGKFGSKLKWTGLDEVVFENRSAKPVYVLLSEGESGPQVEIKSAEHLLGLTTHEKIMALQKNYSDAHFAVIGPAGENYQSVTMGAVALSTENQLKSKKDKCRFAGRGGMGSLMGYKNLIAIVAQCQDKIGAIQPEVKQINKEIIKGGTSTKFQPIAQGGGGGTWANYDVLKAFNAVPENNFRPKGDDRPNTLFRDHVIKELVVEPAGCFRCAIRCHNNIHRRKGNGSCGEFLAKFDYEPLNLLGTNIGIMDGTQVGELIHATDNLGIDAISIGVTISYILDYNERHPDSPIFNGATFGEFEKIMELLVQTGRGELADVGCGVMKLSEKLGETSYAFHVKGLELPAYLPETNPGYIFAIAGGHMSMGTHTMLLREGNTSLDYWVKAITNGGLLFVGSDLIGTCKFIGLGMDNRMLTEAIKAETGLEITSHDLVAAIRRAYLRGLVLELKQGYVDEEFTLPFQVLEQRNHNVTLPHFVTPEFIAAMKKRVWGIFESEMQAL
jgi:aldehyde:ferredoxin oxidoreductase